MKIEKDQLELAKKKLREAINFETVKQSLKRKHFTQEEYECYIQKLESFVFLVLECYISRKSS